MRPPRGSRAVRRRRWFAVVSLALLAPLALAWWMGGSLVASANRPVGPPPADLLCHEVSFSSGSGALVHGWFAPAVEPLKDATVLLLHPNRGDRRSMNGRARLLARAGYAVLWIDLQGHGESGGETITAGYLERHDVQAAVRFIRSREPDQPLGIVGWSLGGASALLAAPLLEADDVQAMVLEAVYPTITEAIENRLGLYLGPIGRVMSPLLTVQLSLRGIGDASVLRPIDRVAEAACPLLFLVGAEDRRTTPLETRAMSARAGERGRVVTFAGAAHEDLLAQAPARYAEVVLGFLDVRLFGGPEETEEGALEGPQRAAGSR